MRRFLYTLLGLVVTAGLAWSTVTEFAPGFALQDGSKLNQLSWAINGTHGMTMGSITVTGITNTGGSSTTGAMTITSASANALAVGRLGATTPAFNVDASTASQIAGLQVKGAVTGGTVAVAAIDSGTDASLSINAKGAGTIGIGSVSTGAVTITPATTITGAITPTGGLAAAGGFTSSCRNFKVGGLGPLVSTDFTNSTPVNTEAYVGEVFVPSNCTATGVAVFNGTDVTDNIKVGFYSSAGALLAQSASTAGSGTDAFQLVPFTSTLAIKGPATYYVVGTYAAGTSRYNAPPLGAFGCGKLTGLTFGTLPTSATMPTTFTANLCNVAGLY